jgi:hypothetical protein
MLTTRCIEWLEILTSKARVLTAEQVARHWFAGQGHATRNAAARLREIARQGYLNVETALVHPEIKLQGPAFCWQPGEQAPHFGQLAYRLQARWKKRPEKVLLATATEEAAQSLGTDVPTRRSRPDEIRHDIHVTQIYLRLWHDDTQAAGAWVHEDVLTAGTLWQNEEFIPDALIDLEPKTAIDFGGAYSASKLRAMHANYVQLKTSYQIW